MSKMRNGLTAWAVGALWIPAAIAAGTAANPSANASGAMPGDDALTCDQIYAQGMAESQRDQQARSQRNEQLRSRQSGHRRADDGRDVDGRAGRHRAGGPDGCGGPGRQANGHARRAAAVQSADGAPEAAVRAEALRKEMSMRRIAMSTISRAIAVGLRHQRGALDLTRRGGGRTGDQAGRRGDDLRADRDRACPLRAADGAQHPGVGGVAPAVVCAGASDGSEKEGGRSASRAARNGRWRRSDRRIEAGVPGGTDGPDGEGEKPKTRPLPTRRSPSRTGPSREQLAAQGQQMQSNARLQRLMQLGQQKRCDKR